MTRMSSTASPGPWRSWARCYWFLATTHAQAGPQYRIAHEVPLPGDEGWTTSLRTRWSSPLHRTRHACTGH